MLSTTIVRPVSISPWKNQKIWLIGCMLVFAAGAIESIRLSLGIRFSSITFPQMAGKIVEKVFHVSSFTSDFPRPQFKNIDIWVQPEIIILPDYKNLAHFAPIHANSLSASESLSQSWILNGKWGGPKHWVPTTDGVNTGFENQSESRMMVSLLKANVKNYVSWITHRDESFRKMVEEVKSVGNPNFKANLNSEESRLEFKTGADMLAGYAYATLVGNFGQTQLRLKGSGTLNLLAEKDLSRDLKLGIQQEFQPKNNETRTEAGFSLRW